LFGDGEPLTPQEEVNSAFCSFVMARCARARIGSTATIGKAATSLTGRPMPDSAAWEWFLEEFLKEVPRYAQPKYEEVIYHGRGRIKSVRHLENKAIARERIDREAAETRARYAEERKANGGEGDFYTSGKWNRLRYQVLMEANGKCVLCGRSQREHGVVMEVDHIKPRSRYPNLSLVKSNLQVLCFDCNRGKSNRDTTDWRNPANDGDQQEEVA
jgi:5-methylcytosine-specific restriction endonuclease McrA